MSLNSLPFLNAHSERERERERERDDHYLHSDDRGHGL